MKIQILDEAEQDIIDGFRFYEAQDEGLGDYFLDSIIDIAPETQSWSGKTGQVHKC